MENHKSTFIEMIKKSCIEESNKEKIIPSLIASLGIIISDWGTTKEFYNTRNIYLLPITDNWTGKCYSKSSETIYASIDDCKESGAVLYKVYSDHKESIKDFVCELLESKRSNNGPYRYKHIIGVTDYKEVVNILIRNGFMQNYLNRVDDIDYINSIISIIEDYNLFEWDNTLKEELEVSKKKKAHKENNPQNTQEENLMVQPQEHIYRVRLDWDKRDTQIFASPSYDDALEAALSHEGYKIYIDDDGELFEDPWEKQVEDVVESEDNTSPKPIIHVLKGKAIALNKTPVYRMALDKHPMFYVTGNFYFYDGSIINNRGKITAHSQIGKPNPNLILGYIDVR